MKTPIHLWIVGILTLLFNAGGAFDYVMTQTQNTAYLSAYTPEQLEFFHGFPRWVVAAWALAVWTALLGSVLLLLRQKLAVLTFGVSVIAMAVTFYQNFFLSEISMIDVVGPEAVYVSFAIVIITVLTFLYARRMALRGILK